MVIYLALVYLVTALVRSPTACLANSLGKMRRTAVWISRVEIVERPLWWKISGLAGDSLEDVIDK